MVSPVARAGEWQPIETAPKDGTELLLWNGEHIIGWWETGREFRGSDHFNDWSFGYETVSGYDAGFKRVNKPTHWQPLPEPPEQGK